MDGERGRIGGISSAGALFLVISVIAVGYLLVDSDNFEPARGFETGASLNMVDSVTGELDSEQRSPKDCASKLCYSTKTGNVLRPMTSGETQSYRLRDISTNALAGIAEKLSSALPSQMDCPNRDSFVAIPGAKFTVMAGCSFTVDQRRMWKTGFDFVLVDPCLREDVRDGELVGFSQDKGSNIVILLPNTEAFKRRGLSEVAMQIYTPGTAQAVIAARHETCSKGLKN